MSTQSTGFRLKTGFQQESENTHLTIEHAFTPDVNIIFHVSTSL